MLDTTGQLVATAETLSAFVELLTNLWLPVAFSQLDIFDQFVSLKQNSTQIIGHIFMKGVPGYSLDYKLPYPFSYAYEVYSNYLVIAYKVMSEPSSLYLAIGLTAAALCAQLPRQLRARVQQPTRPTKCTMSARDHQRSYHTSRPEAGFSSCNSGFGNQKRAYRAC